MYFFKTLSEDKKKIIGNYYIIEIFWLYKKFPVDIFRIILSYLLNEYHDISLSEEINYKIEMINMIKIINFEKLLNITKLKYDSFKIELEIIKKNKIEFANNFRENYYVKKGKKLTFRRESDALRILINSIRNNIDELKFYKQVKNLIKGLLEQKKHILENNYDYDLYRLKYDKDHNNYINPDLEENKKKILNAEMKYNFYLVDCYLLELMTSFFNIIQLSNGKFLKNYLI